MSGDRMNSLICNLVVMLETESTFNLKIYSTFLEDGLRNFNSHSLQLNFVNEITDLIRPFHIFIQNKISNMF